MECFKLVLHAVLSFGPLLKRCLELQSTAKASIDCFQTELKEDDDKDDKNDMTSWRESRHDRSFQHPFDRKEFCG